MMKDAYDLGPCMVSALFPVKPRQWAIRLEIIGRRWNWAARLLSLM